MRGFGWYDKQGNEITTEQAEPLLGDMEYKRVAATQIGPYWVSTVWLGLDHSYLGEGPPIIFETMVFGIQRDDPELDTLGPEIECTRYATEAQALAGHEEICLLIRATIQESPIDERTEHGSDHSRQEDADGDHQQEPGGAPRDLPEGPEEVPEGRDQAPGRAPGAGPGGQADRPGHPFARAR